MRWLGTVTVGAGAANNTQDRANGSAGTPGAGAFAIPQTCHRLHFQSDTAGTLVEYGASVDFETTAARGAALPAANVLSIGYETGSRSGVVVSFWNPGVAAAHVRVYSAD